MWKTGRNNNQFLKGKIPFFIKSYLSNPELSSASLLLVRGSASALIQTVEVINKGTVRIISSDLPCQKKGNARFRTI